MSCTTSRKETEEDPLNGVFRGSQREQCLIQSAIENPWSDPEQHLQRLVLSEQAEWCRKCVNGDVFNYINGTSRGVKEYQTSTLSFQPNLSLILNLRLRVLRISNLSTNPPFGTFKPFLPDYEENTNDAKQVVTSQERKPLCVISGDRCDVMLIALFAFGATGADFAVR